MYEEEEEEEAVREEGSPVRYLTAALPDRRPTDSSSHIVFNFVNVCK